MIPELIGLISSLIALFVALYEFNWKHRLAETTISVETPITPIRFGKPFFVRMVVYSTLGVIVVYTSALLIARLFASEPNDAEVLQWVSALNHSDAEVRVQAAEALAKMGPFADAAVPALRTALDDQSKRVRVKAAEALAKIQDPAMREVLKSLTSSDANQRRKAVRVLGFLKSPPPKAISTLERALQDNDPNVRAEAAVSVGNLAQFAENALANLIRKLNDEDESVRCNVADALAKFAGKAKHALPLLRERMLHGSDDETAHTVRALYRIEPDSKSLVASLAQIMMSDAESWQNAAESLHWLAVDHEDTRIELVDFFTNATKQQPMKTIEVIGYLSSHKSLSIRADIARCLIDAAKNQDPQIRESALKHLGDAKVIAKEAMVVLKNSLQDEDACVRVEAAFALASFNVQHDEEIISVLVAGLKEDLPITRAWSAYCLGRLGKRAETAIPALQAALNDVDEEVRTCATSAFESIQGKNNN